MRCIFFFQEGEDLSFFEEIELSIADHLEILNSCLELWCRIWSHCFLHDVSCTLSDGDVTNKRNLNPRRIGIPKTLLELRDISIK